VSDQATWARPSESSSKDIRSPRKPASSGLLARVRFGIDDVVTREKSNEGLADAGSRISAAVTSLQPVVSHEPYERS
jgi:hypothetical protein